jgi:transposase
MRRYELSPAQFALIEDLLPPNGKRGGQWKDHRRVLNGIFWLLHTGAQWREIPTRYGKWQTTYDRFTRWRRNGTIDRILERLHMKLDADGRIDMDLWLVDSTVIRAGGAAAGARRKKNAPRRAIGSRPRQISGWIWHKDTSGHR